MLVKFLLLFLWRLTLHRPARRDKPTCFFPAIMRLFCWCTLLHALSVAAGSESKKNSSKALTCKLLNSAWRRSAALPPPPAGYPSSPYARGPAYPRPGNATPNVLLALNTHTHTHTTQPGAVFRDTALFTTSCMCGGAQGRALWRSGLGRVAGHRPGLRALG